MRARPSAPTVSSRLLSGLALVAMCFPATAATLVVAALSDVDFDDVTPTAGALRRAVPLCVAMDAPGGYRVRAQGTGEAGAFELTGGVRPVPFSVRFSDRRSGRDPGRWLDAGRDVGGFQSKQRLGQQGCRRLNARLSVRFDAAVLEAAAGGRYSGTVLLTVSPE